MLVIYRRVPAIDLPSTLAFIASLSRAVRAGTVDFIFRVLMKVIIILPAANLTSDATFS